MVDDPVTMGFLPLLSAEMTKTSACGESEASIWVTMRLEVPLPPMRFSSPATAWLWSGSRVMAGMQQGSRARNRRMSVLFIDG